MKSGFLLFLLVILQFLMSCSVDDSFLPIGKVEVETTDEYTKDNVYTNLWIYSQMKYNYLWNTEMPDSSKLDFAIDPVEFFINLLSKKDRFSWCEVNRDFQTRGINLDSTISFDSVYVYGNQRIAYAIYDQFDDNADIRSFAVRMKKAQIDELILDLRYNPGGYVSTCNELASFIVPKEHLGKLYQQQYYNQIITEEKSKAFNNKGVDSIFLKSTQWYSRWGLDMDRIVVLTTENTASASESLIMCLKPYMDVITIGTRTRGKNVGSYTIKSDKYGYQLQPITFKYFNSKMHTVPDDGLVPDILVVEDRKYKRGEVSEPLLRAAIDYLLNTQAN